MKWATNIGKKNLIGLGVCIGKFTRSNVFRIQVTALNLIASYSKVYYI